MKVDAYKTEEWYQRRVKEINSLIEYARSRPSMQEEVFLMQNDVKVLAREYYKKFKKTLVLKF